MESSSECGFHLLDSLEIRRLIDVSWGGFGIQSSGREGIVSTWILKIGNIKMDGVVKRATGWALERNKPKWIRKSSLSERNKMVRNCSEWKIKVLIGWVDAVGNEIEAAQFYSSRSNGPWFIAKWHVVTFYMILCREKQLLCSTFFK